MIETYVVAILYGLQSGDLNDVRRFALSEAHELELKIEVASLISRSIILAIFEATNFCRVLRRSIYCATRFEIGSSMTLGCKRMAKVEFVYEYQD